jgi:predicted molibdopterin-dependent oxidoreductase YjgC
MADVVLPIAGWAEYNGDFINLEGRQQGFKAAMKSSGHALPVYEIIARIAAELKSPIYKSPDQLDKEVVELIGNDANEPLPEEIREVRYDSEEIDSEYPYPLFIVDERHHFGHLTEKSNSLSKFCGEAFLEISPSTAEKLRAENGTLIRVESKVGKIVLPVKISDCLENDVLLAYRNFSASPINQLQMRKRKIDRVRLTRVEEE